MHIPGQKQKSIEYLQKALASVSEKYKESSLKETNAPIDAYLFLGNAYRVNNRLEEAIASYRQYKALLPENEKELHAYVDQQIEACATATSFMGKPVGLYLENMGNLVNGNNDDFRAVLSGDA